MKTEEDESKNGGSMCTSWLLQGSMLFFLVRLRGSVLLHENEYRPSDFIVEMLSALKAKENVNMCFR